MALRGHGKKGLWSHIRIRGEFVMELKVQLHWISLYIQMQWEDEGRRAQDNFLIWEQILSYGMKLQEHVSRITHSSLLRTWQETRERDIRWY